MRRKIFRVLKEVHCVFDEFNDFYEKIELRYYVSSRNYRIVVDDTIRGKPYRTRRAAMLHFNREVDEA